MHFPVSLRGGLALLGVGLLVGVILWLKPEPEPWRWSLPPSFPLPRATPENPMSEAKFQLGRHLFYDKRLSGNQTQACASCHIQALAFTDGRAQPLGSTGQKLPRSAPSLVNAGYYATLTWANPALMSLESQVLVPLLAQHPVEMGLNANNQPEVLRRFNRDERYRRLTAAAFGRDQQLNLERIVQALASFQRGLIAGDSRFDQAERGLLALSAQEERGKKLFFSQQAQCSSCHGGFLFSDQAFSANSKEFPRLFHNTGLYNLGGTGRYPKPSLGLIEVLPQDPRHMGQFRAPSLRNIALSAPYMHDGSIATLEQVLAHYARGGRLISQGPLAGDGKLNPYKSPKLNQIRLNLQEQQDIVAFLGSLTDSNLITNPRFADPFVGAAP